MLGKGDIRVAYGGDEFVYYLNPDMPQSIKHETRAPNVSGNMSSSTPAQAGGSWDLRDTEGDKAIAHLNWKEGAGQRSLDVEDASPSRFKESSYIDISRHGEIGLLKDVVTTTSVNTTGPVFSYAGKVWMGRGRGGLYYSDDKGVTWSTDATCSVTTTATISDFTTDGTHLFYCVSGGDETGVFCNYQSSANSMIAFERYPDSAGTATEGAIQKIAYNNGFLYAATGLGAGVVDSTTGAYTQYTPVFMNQENQTKALVSDGSSVYWVVEKNQKSFVYKLTFDVDAGTMLTEQYAEFPEGFVATCASGYLSNLDVGGYFYSSDPVGRGSVYRINDGYMALLFDIGEVPEETEEPTAAVNDNRIIACCSGSKDVYWLTNRHCYRWDLDDGGYSHVFDYSGAGVATKITNEFAADSLPTGGTLDTDGAYTYHIFSSSGTLTVPVHTDADGNPVDTINAEVLVVGGGGGGGDHGGGGGGGGSVNYLSTTIHGAMAVVIGPGGAHSANGEESKISTDAPATLLASAGGGAGGDYDQAGSNGGSGGGAGGSATARAGGTASDGSDGGDNDYILGGTMPAGGGGGAGAVGADAVDA